MVKLARSRATFWEKSNKFMAKWWSVVLLVAIPAAWWAGSMSDVSGYSAPPMLSLSQESRRMADDSKREFDVGMAGVLEKNGFKFARSPTEYILEAAYARSAENASEPLYSQDELTMILRSLNTMRGFMNQGLWSGSHASMHFLGTGSCLIKLKQPAKQVAIGSMHGVYLQKWRKHAYRGKEDECDKRYRLRTVLGSELETALYLDTGLFGNGPWSTCVSTYIKLWEQNLTKPEPKLTKFLEEAPLYMLFCDEIEEAMGGEAILSGHWKRRDPKFFEDVVKLVTLMGEPRLAEWTRDAQEMSLAMMHPNQAYVHFKELTPPDHDHLFNTAKLNPDADPMDIDRWPTMIDVTRQEQALIPPYNKPNLIANTREGIHRTRDMCDKVDSGEMSLNEYLDEFEKLKEQMLKCEKTDDRFKKAMPLPKEIPQWANPANHPAFQ